MLFRHLHTSDCRTIGVVLLLLFILVHYNPLRRELWLILEWLCSWRICVLE